jgi:hypothetical protein
VEKIMELLAIVKQHILQSNLDGNTRCTIQIEPFLDEEILQNLLYRLRQQFKDVDFKIFSDHHVSGETSVEVDWTMPTYVVSEKDHLTYDD